MRKLFTRLLPPASPRTDDLKARLGTKVLQEKSETADTVFVHIHKCAGTSLIEALALSPRVICCVARPGDFPNRTGRERIPDHIWKRAKKFTFVRHPYERVLSAYNMFMKSEKWRLTFRDFSGFLQFLRWIDLKNHRVEEEIVTSDYVSSIDNVIHHCACYTNPKYMLDQMDFVGRLESFDKDYDRLKKEFGIELPKPKRLNVSQRIGNEGVLSISEANKKLIRAIYADDFDALKYET